MISNGNLFSNTFLLASLIAYMSSVIVQNTENGNTKTTSEVFKTEKQSLKEIVVFYKENGLINKANRIESVIKEFDKVI